MRNNTPSLRNITKYGYRRIKLKSRKHRFEHVLVWEAHYGPAPAGFEVHHGVLAMIYLVSPYSHPDAAVRSRRYLAACRAAACLPTDWVFWQRHDEEYLRCCDELVVLTLDGWRESQGVAGEIQLAQRLGKVVRYYPETSPPGRDICAVSPRAGQYAYAFPPATERDGGQRDALEKNP